MGFSIFINFNGNCREAVTFYAKVFDKNVPTFMTYGDAPPGPSVDAQSAQANKDLVMYTGLNIAGTEVMFCDYTADMGYVHGNNISPVVSSTDMDEVRTLFERLSEGGTVDMPLGETFWSSLYGMVTDKFGITWQVDHDDGREMG